MAAGGTSATRLYTRTGDSGSTALVGGTRVGKDSPRLEAYGTFDELAAWVGWTDTELPRKLDALHPLLRRIQHELFLAENELATPAGREPPGGRILARHVAGLEHAIDQVLGPGSGAPLLRAPQRDPRRRSVPCSPDDRAPGRTRSLAAPCN